MKVNHKPPLTQCHSWRVVIYRGYIREQQTGIYSLAISQHEIRSQYIEDIPIVNSHYWSQFIKFLLARMVSISYIILVL